MKNFHSIKSAKVSSLTQSLFLGLGLVFLFQNCSDVAFKKQETAPPTPEEKQEIIEDMPVFDDPGETVVFETPEVYADVNLPAYRMCGKQITIDKGGAQTNLIEAQSLRLKVVGDNGVSCENNDTESVRQAILEERELHFPECELRGEVEAEVSLVDQDGKSLLIEYDDPNKRGGAFKIPATVKREVSIAEGGVLQSANSLRPFDVVVGSYNPARHKGGVGDASTCDQLDSPLFIDLRPRAGSRSHFYLNLTAPWEGILFDIRGLKADKPFEKEAISWVKSPSLTMHFLFLTLPGRNGKVEGINQMFGNNTLGPDGLFAKDGFEALSKWDGKVLGAKKDLKERNGYIDKGDEVYKKLRVWSDYNVDGKAEYYELKSLEEIGIESIDLNYDRHYYERDRYGNEVRYKSVVKKKKGGHGLIFDLWFFRHVAPEAIVK